MQLDPESGPTRVLIVSEKYELPEPLRIDRLLVDDLDTDQLAAVTAATVLEEPLSRVLDSRDGVERASKALGESVSHSERAAESHERLTTALRRLDEAIADLADAEDALNFHWPTRAPEGANP